jgi:hypothetical protein
MSRQGALRQGPDFPYGNTIAKPILGTIPSSHLTFGAGVSRIVSNSLLVSGERFIELEE